MYKKLGFPNLFLLSSVNSGYFIGLYLSQRPSKSHCTDVTEILLVFILF